MGRCTNAFFVTGDYVLPVTETVQLCSGFLVVNGLLNSFSIILGYDEKHDATRKASGRKAGIHIDGWWN